MEKTDLSSAELALTAASSIHILRQTRRLTFNALSGLSEAQFFEMPPGFDNNIAWNLGHILVSQQSLIYRRSGLEMGLSAEMFAMYKPGTSPADWEEQPDIAPLIEMLLDQPEQLAADYAAGKFERPFEESRTSTGVILRSTFDTMVFNNYHEGLHLGTMLALKNFVA